MRIVANAQDILCRQRGIGKEEAYRIIREQAMCKRTTAEEIAAAIVHGHEVLSFKIELAMEGAVGVLAAAVGMRQTSSQGGA